MSNNMQQKRRTFLMLTVFAGIGAIMVLYGLIVAIMMEQPGWHTPVLVGGTTVLAYFVYLIDRAGILWDLVVRPIRVPLQYVIYAMIGVVIELIGQQLLGWWSYSFSPILEVIHVILLGYPFMFFMLFELYVLAQWFLRYMWLTIPVVWLLTIIMNEGPNLVAQQWVYDIPFAGWSVAGLHVIVLIGWVIPVVLPLVVRHFLGLPIYVPRGGGTRE